MANGIRNAASIINQMKYSPIKQQELAGAAAAEGQDNRAVSQYDRMVGKQVASEEARMQELDKFADNLAMRKDKLAFARKVNKEQQAMTEEKFNMQEDAFSHKQLFQGLEGVVGLAGVGVNIARTIKKRKLDRIESEKRDEELAVYKSMTVVQSTDPTKPRTAIGFSGHRMNLEY
jgi:hypothetical protein